MQGSEDQNQYFKSETMNNELKEYEVWSQGWSSSDGNAQAHLIGKTIARSFRQACHIIMCQKYLENIKKVNDPNYKEYFNPDRWDYDSKGITVWGCSLYDNEADARKSFG